jgi:hypothetical protein
MSAKLETHAEIVKISHLLQLDPEELEYLGECAPETLIDLRMQLVELFYGDENSNLKRFAKLGNLLPTSVIAGLTREAVGPILAARVAGFVDPKQAASVVSKLPVDFVVDIAVAIDPRRVAPVVSRLDVETVEQLALELVDRKEYVTMGQFIGFAPDEVLNAVFRYASDEALLHTAFVAEAKDRISVALAPQTDERIASIIKAAIKKDLWPEAIDLFAQLSDEQYVRVINIASKLPPTTLDKLVEATTRHEVWPMMIPAISQMDNPDRAAEALLRAEPISFRTFTTTVVDDKAWDDIEDLLSKLSDERVAEVIKTMIKDDLWPEAMELVSHLSKEQHARVVNLAAKFSPGILDKMVAATTHHGVWPQLISAIARMDNPNRACDALLRGTNEDVKGFASTVGNAKAWKNVELLMSGLSDANRTELMKRLGKLKLADAFNQISPMLAA